MIKPQEDKTMFHKHYSWDDALYLYDHWKLYPDAWKDSDNKVKNDYIDTITNNPSIALEIVVALINYKLEVYLDKDGYFLYEYIPSPISSKRKFPVPGLFINDWNKYRDKLIPFLDISDSIKKILNNRKRSISEAERNLIYHLYINKNLNLPVEAIAKILKRGRSTIKEQLVKCFILELNKYTYNKDFAILISIPKYDSKGNLHVTHNLNDKDIESLTFSEWQDNKAIISYFYNNREVYQDLQNQSLEENIKELKEINNLIIEAIDRLDKLKIKME